MGNILDIALCIILGCFVVLGFHNGFVRSFVEFVGCIFALMASAVLANLATDLLRTLIVNIHKVTQTEYLFLKLISIAILFVALQSLAHLCARALDAVCELPLLHQVNALLGGIFGLLKGAVAVIVLCTLLQMTLPLVETKDIQVKGQQICAASRIYHYVWINNPLPILIDNVILLKQAFKMELPDNQKGFV